FWLGKDFQTGPDNLRTKMVALLRVEFLLRRFLKVRRLRVHEQFIDRQPLVFRKRAEVDAEFDDRQQVERFLRAHRMRVSQNAISAADLVPKRARFYLDQD